MTTAIVTGGIVTYPVGGVAWDYGHYALGLERLGMDVLYLEDTGLYPYDPTVGYSEDCSYGVQFLERFLHALSPSLGSRWHYRPPWGGSFGVPGDDLRDAVEDATLLVNVSGLNLLRDDYMTVPHKVFVDTDPGLNHFFWFPSWDARPERDGGYGYRHHDHFFTYAERLGEGDCPLPDQGLDWQPTRPPVLLDLWERDQGGGSAWTTVMSWDNYSEPIVANGVSYGAKEVEFPSIERLPHRVPFPLEVAVGGVEPPTGRWRDLGWSVVDGPSVSARPSDYRRYIASSRGELAVAKNVYVATRSGWFSCRSACYLAAARPVVLQDTGWSQFLPAGEGLLSFVDEGSAATALEAVESDYEGHRSAAREIAAKFLDAEAVLGEMVARVGVS